VSLSVAVILFEGGLSLDIAELREIGKVLRNLVTIGVMVTWIASTLLARLLLDFDWALATLLGAVLVVTGPTVIVPLLRHVRPSPRVGSAIKWEGLVNDPIGAILAVLVFEAILSGAADQTGVAVLGVLKALASGVGFGLIGAAVIFFALRRYWVPDFLQNPVALAGALLAFTLANILQRESGLLAVTVMGSALASQKVVPIQNIVEFKENLRILLISVLFVVLAARLPASSLGPDMGSLLFVGALILIVRPTAVALATAGTRLNWRERCFLGLMAPRGIVAAAVSSIFALDLAHEGFSDAERLIPVTFLVIVGTVVTYGLAAPPVARHLKVASPNPQGLLLVGADPWVRALARLLQSQGLSVVLVDSNWTHVAEARQAGLQAHYGNVLSEHVMEELELDGIGRLLALTSNDEVNALAALHFSEVFGNAGVYQIAPPARRSRDRDRTLPGHLTGRFLFDTAATHEAITRRVQAGAVFKKTPITEEFDFEDFRAQHGDSALPLFTLKNSKELTVLVVGDTVSLKAGQALISLVGP
jgi:NhaP-type Na+/H+ or K+/H+ antiporter